MRRDRPNWRRLVLGLVAALFGVVVGFTDDSFAFESIRNLRFITEARTSAR